MTKEEKTMNHKECVDSLRRGIEDWMVLLKESDKEPIRDRFTDKILPDTTSRVQTIQTYLLLELLDRLEHLDATLESLMNR